MPKKPRADLFSFTCKLNTDGNVELEYNSVNPDDFAREMENKFPQYEGTFKVSSLIRYLRQNADEVMNNSGRYV